MANSQYPEVLQGPSVPPPPGVISNLDDPTNLATVDYVVAAACISLSTLIIGLRFYSKIAITKSFGSDDLVLLVGWAIFVAFCVDVVLLAHLGIARHLWDIRIGEVVHIIEPALKHVWIDLILFAAATAAIKVAIFLQFLRILNPSKERGYLFWTCWSCIVFFSVFYLSVILAGVFTCDPIAKYWKRQLPGHCGDARPLPIVSAAANIASDVVILLLPQGAIWQLNMSLKLKFKVSLIFFVGLFALAASVLRLYYTVLFDYHTDMTWNVNQVGLWIMAEIVITIACSSVPSIHGLLRHWGRSVMETGKSHSASYRSGPASRSCTVVSHSSSQKYQSEGNVYQGQEALQYLPRTSSATKQAYVGAVESIV